MQVREVPTWAAGFNDWWKSDETFPEAVNRVATEKAHLIAEHVGVFVQLAKAGHWLLQNGVDAPPSTGDARWPALTYPMLRAYGALPPDAPLVEFVGPALDQASKAARTALEVDSLRVVGRGVTVGAVHAAQALQKAASSATPAFAAAGPPPLAHHQPARHELAPRITRLAAQGMQLNFAERGGSSVCPTGVDKTLFNQTKVILNAEKKAAGLAERLERVQAARAKAEGQAAKHSERQIKAAMARPAPANADLLRSIRVGRQLAGAARSLEGQLEQLAKKVSEAAADLTKRPQDVANSLEILTRKRELFAGDVVALRAAGDKAGEMMARNAEGHVANFDRLLSILRRFEPKVE
jgi:hypothetical protein